MPLDASLENVNQFKKLGTNTLGYPVPFTPIIPAYFVKSPTTQGTDYLWINETQNSKGYRFIPTSYEITVLCSTRQSVNQISLLSNNFYFLAEITGGIGTFDGSSGSKQTYFNTFSSRKVVIADIEMVVDLVDYEQSGGNNNENARLMTFKWPIHSVSIDFGLNWFFGYMLRATDDADFSESGRAMTSTVRGYYESTITGEGK